MLQVVDDLLQSGGRELFTDNYYTSIKLAKHLFEKYGWTFCGTITPTDKKSRSSHDVPFLKLSRSARDSVPRGWFREAVLELKTNRGKRFCIQCTTWKDKKQVKFLHIQIQLDAAKKTTCIVMFEAKENDRRSAYHKVKSNIEHTSMR